MDFALHRLVWAGDAIALRTALTAHQHDLEEMDVNKRTPFRLAIALGKYECAKLLIDFGASMGGADVDGWTAVHDATCTGDSILLRMVLEMRNKAQGAEAQARIPQLLQLLETDGDFYVEMSWDFTSWVPLVSRLCPSDVYRIWKRGGCVRVDTTLLGYHNLRWIRGNRSYLFRCTTNAESRVDFEMIHLDHDQKLAVMEDLFQVNGGAVEPVSNDEIVDRLNLPVAVTMMNSDTIGFSRDKSGIWPFNSADRTELVGPVQAKVFNVSGIDIITRTRYEHLPPRHPARKQSHSFMPLSQVMSSADDTEASASAASASEDTTLHTATCGSVEDYLHPKSAQARTVPGRPRQSREKRQQFKAQVWMAEEFPLSLQRQVLPVVDLMAPTSQHIAKLRDFISLQLPAGFPVKIEIPVYHLVHARVTFGNYSSQVDESVFQVPADYELRSPQARSETPTSPSDELGGQVDADLHYARSLQYSMAYHDELDDTESRVMQHALALSLAESGAQPWACDVCTYANSKLHDRCEMCDTPRAGKAAPPAITASRRAVAGGALSGAGSGASGAGGFGGAAIGSSRDRLALVSVPAADLAGSDFHAMPAEDPALQQAIALSLATHSAGHGAAPSAGHGVAVTGAWSGPGHGAELDDDAAELQRVLELSKIEK